MNNYLITNPFGVDVIVDGVSVMRSKNLRAMMRYASISPVAVINATRDLKNAYNGRLNVTYANGATCSAFFSDYRVMVEWIGHRRSWRNAIRVERS